MKKNVLIKKRLIRISLCFFLVFTTNIYGKDKILLSELELSKKFNITNIDIDKDGVLDKILSGKSMESDKLYIFKNIKGKYNLIFEGTNFSYEGLYRVLKIQEEKNEMSFSIHTQFASKGSDKVIYYVSYKNSNFIINKIIYTFNSWQKDYTKTYFCTVKENTNLNKLQGFKSAPLEKERNKLCSIDYYMEKSLSKFILRFKDIDNQNSIRDIERYKVLLQKFPLVIKNLTTYNNIAYYLQKAGANEEAIYLLEKILEKYPNRTVAHYNLADAYWALGEKKKAIASYTTYIEQMCNAGKEKRIPQVVRDRVSSK